jgi:hypothetical protein
MSSSGMWRVVGFVRIGVSEEQVASIFRVEGVSELRTALAATSRTSVLTRATRRHIPEDGILHSYLREIIQFLWI